MPFTEVSGIFVYGLVGDLMVRKPIEWAVAAALIRQS